MAEPAFVEGIAALADRYEGFVLDQWGVLHNGTRPYPGAIELVAELKRRNKRIVLLSNSGRRADHNARQLAHIGYNPAGFDAIVTSGEVCWQSLHQRTPAPFDRLGDRCMLIGREGETAPLDGIAVELVADPEDADFIYLGWVEANPRGEALMARAIEVGIKRGLLMICGNPDRLAPVEGGMVEAPGTFAARYEQAGGEVVYVGKPHRPIYTALLNQFEGFDLGEIICVGDSLEHDIQGANGVGLASVLITGGLHVHEIGPQRARAAQVSGLNTLMSEHNAHPDYVTAAFRW